MIVIDSLTLEELDTEKDGPLFKYNKDWDEYSGEIKSSNTHKVLYFHPHNLLYYYYTKRYTKLWNDHGNMCYSLGDGIGAGKTFNVNGKENPDWYLFRIPDLHNSTNNLMCPRMTPHLKDEEIEHLIHLCKINKWNFEDKYNIKMPDLKKYTNCIIM